MADYLTKRGANVAPSYATTGDLPASTQAGDLVFVAGQLGIAVDASTFKTCDKTDVATWSQTGTLTYTVFNPEGASGNDFGYTLDTNNTYWISGNWNRASSGTGVVYLHKVSDGTVYRTTTNPNSNASDAFAGYENAISDTYFAVGAPGYNGWAGRCYVYNISTGALVYTITGSAGNQLGLAMEMTDTHLIVDAWGANEARVYTLSNGALAYTKTVTSGYLQVGINDTHFIVGEENANEAKVYSLSDGSLVYTKTESSSVDYGRNVAMNSTHFAVADPTFDSNKGAVYVYAISDGSLVASLHNTSGLTLTTSSYFGGQLGRSGLKMSENYIAVGSGTNTEKVWIFKTEDSGATWTLDYELSAPATGGRFCQVTVGQNVFIASGYKYNSASSDGTVYVYK